MSGGTSNGGATVNDELTNLKLDSVVEISVLALFFVQHIGKASMKDVDEGIKKINGEVNEHLLHQSMEGLRARGLLSYARGTSKSGGNIQMYKVTKVKWAHPPEIAHISNLLPALVATEEARAIIDTLNNAEESGKGGVKKAKTRLGYTDYFDLSVTFKTKGPILGSQVDSPYLRKLLEKSTYPYPLMEKGQNILRFWRDEDTGAVMIPSDVISGWLRTGLRMGFGLSDAVINYCGVSDVIINPGKDGVGQVSLPVIDQQTKKGLGINIYEVIGKGTEFEIHFRLPKKGLADPNKFIAWLVAYAPRPIRGLSPARGKRFGKMEVVAYKLLGDGDSSVIEHSLNSITEELDDPRAKSIHMLLLAKAKQFNMSYKDGKGGNEIEDDSASVDSEDMD